MATANGTPASITSGMWVHNGELITNGRVEYSGGIVSNWRRWSPALGDLNGDGAVSLSDVAQLTGCLDGPGAGL
ncbi:MAG TPA: hypothetical protein VGM03_06365, partial [Phycisphaerae bacterium]